MEKGRKGLSGRRLWLLAVAAAWSVEFTAGCARLPYTTKTIHEDERVVVTVQQEVEATAYTHPVQLTGTELASLLRGFSIREQQRLPLRWFAEELPPKPLFREDELQALAPHLADGLQKLGVNERAHFEVRAPGFNPDYGRDTIAGRVAVREPYLYVTIEYFHNQIPIRKSDLYDYNYPLPPPTPKNYILYFEPGRFWISDDKGRRGVDFRQFLRSGEAGPSRAPQPSPPAAP
ncbi:MAG: hypothetical protein OJF52_000978 [Nitrospira sp.]|jgi:hypothetical protein|nr:MAG: hypothetical protein OJF52_000978 [Nitrospira sp.]